QLVGCRVKGEDSDAGGGIELGRTLAQEEDHVVGDIWHAVHRGARGGIEGVEVEGTDKVAAGRVDNVAVVRIDVFADRVEVEGTVLGKHDTAVVVGKGDTRGIDRVDEQVGACIVVRRIKSGRIVSPHKAGAPLNVVWNARSTGRHVVIDESPAGIGRRPVKGADDGGDGVWTAWGYGH